MVATETPQRTAQSDPTMDLPEAQFLTTKERKYITRTWRPSVTWQAKQPGSDNLSKQLEELGFNVHFIAYSRCSDDSTRPFLDSKIVAHAPEGWTEHYVKEGNSFEIRDLYGNTRVTYSATSTNLVPTDIATKEAERFVLRATTMEEWYIADLQTGDPVSGPSSLRRTSRRLKRYQHIEWGENTPPRGLRGWWKRLLG